MNDVIFSVCFITMFTVFGCHLCLYTYTHTHKVTRD